MKVLNWHLTVRVCVRACVCGRARERERDQTKKKMKSKEQQYQYLRILGFCDINKDLGSRMNNVKKLHYGGAIIRDGGISFVIMDQFVHSSWTKSGPHNISHSHACIYVAYQLGFALRCISSFLEQYNLGLLLFYHHHQPL